MAWQAESARRPTLVLVTVPMSGKSEKLSELYQSRGAASTCRGKATKKILTVPALNGDVVGN